ncbi:MAG: diguanylate cyclase [Fidelibacterota bacterium]
MDNLSFRNISLAGISALLILLSIFLRTEFSVLAIALSVVAAVLLLGLMSLNWLTIHSNEKQADNSNIPSQPDTDAVDNSRQIYDFWLNRIESVIHALNPSYDAGIYFLDPKTGKMILQNFPKRDFQPHIPASHRYIKKVTKHDEVIVYQEKDNRDDWEGILKKQTWRGSECLLAARIKYHGSPFGCLFVFTDHFSKIEKRDAGIIQNIARTFEEGIAQVEEIESLELLHHFSQRIFNLYTEIHQETPLEEVFEEFGKVISNLCRFEAFTLSLKLPSDKFPKVYYALGSQANAWQGISFPLQNTIHGYSISQEKILFTNNWEKDLPGFSRFGPEYEEIVTYPAVLSVPLVLNQHGLGSIVLEKEEPNTFSPMDLQLLKEYAHTVAAILTWIYHFKSTHIEATFDHLTRLLNRRSFMERLNRDIQRAIRFQQTLVLLMLDIDHFKNVNDTHGHLYGDYILKQVAKLIQSSVRDIDVVGRYGGEEFVVVLVNTTKEFSEQIARRILHSIANYEFEDHGIRTRITISGGAAQFPDDADEKRSLIKLADDAMYEAKKAGRNRVFMHGHSIP